MEFSPTQQLPCPSDTDYAAVALYLQYLAETFEARIVAQRALITDFATQPYGLWGNFGALVAGVGSTITAIDITNPISNNIPSRNLVGFATAPANGMFPEAGVYHVGWNVTMAETGGVSAGTARSMTFLIQQLTADGTPFVLQNLSRRVMASTLATERFGNDGLVVVGESARPQIGARIEFGHANVASSVQITAGALRGWYRRLGSTAQIEVA